MTIKSVGTRPKLPQYINDLCTRNLSFYPAPYEYILHQNKHIGNTTDALETKMKKIEKFIMRHSGEFKLLSEEPYIKGDQLCFRITFNCDVVVVKEMDRLIGRHINE